MFFAFLMMILMILLDLAAWRWGVDSRDMLNGSDWVLRLPTQRA